MFGPDEAPLGRVEHVLAAPEEDIFDGLLIRGAPGGWRFADATCVVEIHERGVLLSVGAEALHEPSENPAALASTPEDTDEGLAEELERKLRRAWDYISGNY